MSNYKVSEFEVIKRSNSKSLIFEPKHLRLKIYQFSFNFPLLGINKSHFLYLLIFYIFKTFYISLFLIILLLNFNREYDFRVQKLKIKKAVYIEKLT